MHQTGIIALFRSPPHSAVTSSLPLTGVAERALAGEVPVGGVGAAEGAVVTPVGQAGVELDAAVDARVARLTLAAVAAEPVETDAVQTGPRRAVILVTLTVTACTQRRGGVGGVIGEGERARRGGKEGGRAGRDRRRADRAAARSRPRYSHSYGLHTEAGWGGGGYRRGGEGEERGQGGGPSRSRQTPCRHGRGAQSSSLLSQLRPAHRSGGCLEGAERGRGEGARRGAEPVKTDAVQTGPRRAVILVTLTVTACTQRRGGVGGVIGEGERARRGGKEGGRAGRDRRRADTAAARSRPRYSHSYGLHTGAGGV